MQDMIDITSALRVLENKLREAGLIVDSARMEDLREQFERCDVGYLETSDGLYASFDGWQITLRAPRAGGDHWVALEPELYTNLIRFAERINGKYGVEHFKALRGRT
jgi:hypothetical protein